MFFDEKEIICPTCKALIDSELEHCPFCGIPLEVIGYGPNWRDHSNVLGKANYYSEYKKHR